MNSVSWRHHDAQRDRDAAREQALRWRHRKTRRGERSSSPSGVADSVRAVFDRMTVKPADESPLQLLAGSADGAAVIRVGHFPEHDSGIEGLDPPGMPHRDIAVV